MSETNAKLKIEKEKHDRKPKHEQRKAQKKLDKKIKRKQKDFGSGTGAQVAGTKITGAQTAIRNDQVPNWLSPKGGAETKAPKRAFLYFAWALQ
uniref:Uncharacterized protein n=1 Tax=Romanomermis culicivorax TaxID=13658 RepID=A0A915I0S9_ROMCU